MRYFVINLRSPYCEETTRYYSDMRYQCFNTDVERSLEKYYNLAVEYFADDIFPFFERQYRYADECSKSMEEAFEAFLQDCMEESDYEEITTDEYREAQETENWKFYSYTGGINGSINCTRE